MMKFTKEEISLCKQIVEKHRKEVVQGDWIVNSKNKRLLVSGVELWKIQRPGLEHTMAYDLDPVDRLEDAIVTLDEQIKEYIPLWTISDCLEFLKKRGYRVTLFDEDLVASESFHAKCYGHKSKEAFYNFGKTLLVALLKAVLAVLEEGK